MDIEECIFVFLQTMMYVYAGITEYDVWYND